MSYLKQKLSLPLVKYSLFGIASGLWVFGLVDQLYDSAGDDEIPAVVAADGRGRLYLIGVCVPALEPKRADPVPSGGSPPNPDRSATMFVPLLAVPLAVQLIAAAPEPAMSRGST